MTRFLASAASWLRGGYPAELPPTDHVPIVTLLTRQSSPAQVLFVAGGTVTE